MKTKSKTFARKLTALFLAAIMAISCFTGAVTAFAKSTDDYHDSNLAYNFMTWAEASDNQTCEALLDWADLHLGDLLSGLLGSDHIFFEQNVVVATIKIDAYLDSIDGVIDLLRQAADLLNSYGGIIGGDVKNVNLKPLPALPSVTQGDAVISKCGRSYRAANDAKTIVMALAETLYKNTNNNDGSKNVIGQFIKGSFSLGSILEGVLGGNVFDLLKDTLNMWDGYQNNLVYNIVANLIFENTLWYTEEEANQYKAYLKDSSKGTRWNFDEQLLDKLSTELLQKININVTYDIEKNTDETLIEPDGDVQTLKATDNSQMRYAEIKKLMKAGKTFAEASIEVGSDPNLHYTEEGNVYLFQYGYAADGETPTRVFAVDKNVTVVEAVFDALEIAWNTVLKDTMNLIHVNYSNWENDQKGLSTNFDNAFYYWLAEQNKWDKNDWASNYSDKNVNDWAEAVAGTYGYTGPTAAEDFLAQVEADVTLDRTIATPEGEAASWKDIDATRLFMKLRYSPLADKHFNIQTGPINLYILQTGYSNLKTFLSTAFTEYGGIVPALNNALVAAVYDFFPQSANIGIKKADGSIQNVTMPTLRTTSNTPTNSDISSALVNNALTIFEYAANVTDQNILNPFYQKHNISTITGNLTEANFEEAMIPMLIACVTQIDMLDPVHPEAWDRADDAEGVAFIALREYLSYVLPEKDYDSLVSTSGPYRAVVDVNGDSKMDLYSDVILVMARDAVGYLLNSIVPCRKPNGSEWNVYTSDPVTDSTTLFEILNSVVCYYASMDTFTEPDGTTTKGKGVASLLGIVDGSGNCLVSKNNDLWTNIDVISRKLFPIFGTMQYGTTAKAGQSSSKEIIYDTIVMGLLDIGTVNSHSGKMGITTILDQLLTICTADPVQNKSALLVIYDDILASLLNAIFGARDSRQGYTQVVPYSSEYGANASTPFDQLVQVRTLGSYGGKQGVFGGDNDPGILGVLISNVWEFFGGHSGSYSTKALNDGCWQGAMFAVNAVNNFIPSFVPQMSEHSFAAATITLDNPSEQVKGGTPRKTTYLKFVNNCTGLNRFYKDKDGTIKRSPRYFVKMKKISKNLANGAAAANITASLPNQNVVAPEQTAKISVGGTNANGTQLIKFVVTYDIFEGELGSNGSLPTQTVDNTLYEDLEATAYLYLTTQQGWLQATLSDETNIGTAEEPDMVKIGDVYDDELFTSVGDAYIYNNIVISTADPSQVNSYGLHVAGSEGLMALDDQENAYAVVDGKTGDLLNTGRVDYKLGSADWNRGSTTTINGKTVHTGFTANEVASIGNQAQENKVEFATRPHVAMTLAEAGNLVKSIDGEEGDYKAVTVDPDLIMNGYVSASTPTHGISFLDLSDASSEDVKFLKYDGTTNIKPDSYTMNTVSYSGGSMSDVVETNVIFANDAEAVTLTRQYNEYLKEMAPYQKTDFDDYDEDTLSSNTNDALQASFQAAVTATSMPITVDNAASLVSTTETVAQTADTTADYGDIAYKPIPSSQALQDDIAKLAKAYNGYWYLDEAHKLAVYGHTELTDADVSNGRDAAGLAVVKGEDNKWHVATTTKYVYGWRNTNTAYPFYGKTEEIATTKVDNEDVTVKLNTQYEFHMADGAKCDSGDPWTYKFAITKTQIKENDGTDYRGYYQKVMDALAYNVEIAKKHIDTKLVSQISEGIIEERKGMNNVNYEVAVYEKMVRVAKTAEALVYEEEVTDENGDTTKRWLTNASSVEIREAKRQYDKYKDLADFYARGYIGDKLEAEIACASGTAFNNLTATVVEDEDGNVTSATVAKKTNVTPAYGKYDSTGKLANLDDEGEQAYTDSSWNAYVTELAKAVKMATEGEAALSAIYTQKCALAIAENNLVEAGASTSFAISGKVVMAIDAQGTAGTVGVKANFYIGRVNIGHTEADGTFTIAEVPNGTTEITVKAIAGQSKFADRVITISEDGDIANAEIAVNAFDVNNDSKVNSTDVVIFSDAPFDMTGDGAATKADEGAMFKSAVRTGVELGSLALN